MQLLNNHGKNRIRIIIGHTEYGFKGIKKPTKTITVIDAEINEVYKIIQEAIKKKIEKNGK